MPANAGDAGDTGSIPGLVRSPGEGNGNPPLKPQIMGKCLTLGIVNKIVFLISFQMLIAGA